MAAHPIVPRPSPCALLLRGRCICSVRPYGWPIRRGAAPCAPGRSAPTRSNWRRSGASTGERFNVARPTQSTLSDDRTAKSFRIVQFKCACLHSAMLRIASAHLGPSCTHSATKLRGVMLQLLQYVSCFAAQQGNITLTIDARQIHPHPQLPRPHLARRVIGFAANRQERPASRGELLNQRPQRLFLARGPTVNQLVQVPHADAPTDGRRRRPSCIRSLPTAPHAPRAPKVGPAARTSKPPSMSAGQPARDE